jgi:hypothetical protein
MLTAAAPVWHFWIAVALTIPGVFLIIFTIIGYLTKVVAPKYPRQRR